MGYDKYAQLKLFLGELIKNISEIFFTTRLDDES